jgi:hypothetical protein
VRLVSQRLAGRRVRSLCWALLRFRRGGRSRIAMIVCTTVSCGRATYLSVVARMTGLTRGDNASTRYLFPSILVSRAEDWPWSSARAHLAGVDDNLVTVRPVLDRTTSFADLLLQDRGQLFTTLRRSEGSGRPLGTAEFVTGLERLLGRPIARRSPGPKPANCVDGEQLELLQ